MTVAEPSRRERRGSRKPRRTLVWIIGGVVLLLVAMVAWVGVRGLLAKNELEAAIPLASTLRSQVLAQETDKVEKTALTLNGHAREAAALTSDPIWRMAEFMPGVGPNLTAFRELSAVVDNFAEGAVAPLTELATSIEVADFKPVDGKLDLQPLADARPVVERATAAVDAAQKSLGSIDTSATIKQIGAAKVQLGDQLSVIAAPVEAIRMATVLMPAMLGDSGPREFLLLFQNPAELRSSGGIPGALALVRTENGRMELSQQAAASSFPEFADPVLPLSDETRVLYGDVTGKFMQNVNLTPQFPVSASLAAEMWKREYGSEVSGVLSIDPIALSYILEATGPISLVTGDELTSENAVSLVLRDAYDRYSKPAQQDAFFAAAASAVFDRIAQGNVDPSKLIAALARSGEERRVNLWSAIESEQNEVAGTTLAGAVPVSSPGVKPFGVYLNDATGAKMDYYLDVQVANGQTTCRDDRRPQFAVEVTLTNTAPGDAATALPAYVTGAGVYGVAPGNIKTLLNVYGDPTLQNLGVARGADMYPYLPATDSGFQVSQISVELAPGESATFTFGFLGDSPFDGEIVTEQTPVIYRNETEQLTLTCESPLW